MKTKWSCPICYDVQDGISYAMPCCHQFCVGCILRWANTKLDCPLCRRPIETIKFSVRAEDDFIECFIAPEEELPDASSEAGGAPGHPDENNHHIPVVFPPSSPQEAAGPQAMAGLVPEEWAELFQRDQHLLDPVLPWLRQQLEAIYGAWWWVAEIAEATIMHALCVYGPNRQLMVPFLQPVLQEHTEPVVSGVFRIIEGQCSAEARRLLLSRTDPEEDDLSAASSTRSSLASSPASSSSSSCATTPACSSSRTDNSDCEEEPGTSETTLHRVPCRASCAEQEQEQPQSQPQKEQRMAVAACPSAQGCSRSAPGRGKGRSPGRPRRAPKGKASSPQDSPQPCKRPRL